MCNEMEETEWALVVAIRAMRSELDMIQQKLRDGKRLNCLGLDSARILNALVITHSALWDVSKREGVK